MSDASVDVTVDTLPFIVSIDDGAGGEHGGEMGIFGRRDGEVSIRRIPVEVLRENVRQMAVGLRALFDEIDEGEGRLPLQEAQICFEVTASGGIALVGTSAQLARGGAITLTFRR